MKRTLAVLLSLLMLFGCLPVTGFSVSDGAADGNAAAFMRIVHLDCGRKYFSVEEIKGVIDMAAEFIHPRRAGVRQRGPALPARRYVRLGQQHSVFK